MMCLASKYLGEVQETFQQINNSIRKLRSLLSQCDKGMSKIYHEIEIGKFNAAQRCKLIERQQEILRNRRVIKHELDNLLYVKKMWDQNRVYNGLQSISQRLENKLEKDSETDYTVDWGIRIVDIMAKEDLQSVN